MVNMFENHGFLFCRPLIVDYSFALFGDTDVNVSQTLVNHEILFFFFFFVGANNRTNVCETLHSLEASGGDTSD